jgi:hypothetical protein
LKVQRFLYSHNIARISYKWVFEGEPERVQSGRKLLAFFFLFGCVSFLIKFTKGASAVFLCRIFRIWLPTCAPLEYPALGQISVLGPNAEWKIPCWQWWWMERAFLEPFSAGVSDI